MARILIAGCGYVGSALATQLAARGHHPLGLRRSPGAPPAGALLATVDLCDATAMRRCLATHAPFDCAVYAASPGRGLRGDPTPYRRIFLDGLGNLLDALAQHGHPPGAIFFTSSTSVYSQGEGAVVDETSPALPDGYRGETLLAAEARLRDGCSAPTVLRLAGIYGPGRTGFVTRLCQTLAPPPGAPPRYTNRIHRDDAAGALAHLIDRRIQGERLAALYLGVDDEPAAEALVQRWLAARLGISLPTRPAPDAPPPRRAAVGNKRCSNARLRASGYRFRYPSFREGYSAVLDADPGLRGGRGHGRGAHGGGTPGGATPP